MLNKCLYSSNKITLFSNYMVNTKEQYNQRHLFFCLLLLGLTQVRGFRIIFGYPVNGQRTWSNANTAKRNNHILYKYKYSKFSQLASAQAGTYQQSLLLAEYVNLFWQQQWLSEWLVSYRLIKMLPIYIRNTNYIDLGNINRFYIYSYYNNPFKVTKVKQNKKKRVLPKNKFSTGFTFGFSIIYSTKINQL